MGYYGPPTLSQGNDGNHLRKLKFFYTHIFEDFMRQSYETLRKSIYLKNKGNVFTSHDAKDMVF